MDITLQNEVFWVNPEIRAPFRLSEGHPCNLAWILAYKQKSHFKQMLLEVWVNHYRTGILGRVLMTDKEGRKYRDVDLKGCSHLGYVYPSLTKGIPTISLRVFPTKARIGDAARPELIKGVIEIVSNELRLSSFSRHDYATWFVRTLGSQVGRLHKLGYAHGYLTHHNITLDCRLVDFDSVKPVDPKTAADRFSKDKKDALEALSFTFLPVFLQIKDMGELIQIFDESYRKAIRPQ